MKFVHLFHENELQVTELTKYNKGVGTGPAGLVLAGPLFLKVKTKFHFTKSK